MVNTGCYGLRYSTIIDRLTINRAIYSLPKLLLWYKARTAESTCDYVCLHNFPPRGNDDPFFICSSDTLCNGDYEIVWHCYIFRSNCFGWDSKSIVFLNDKNKYFLIYEVTFFYLSNFLYSNYWPCLHFISSIC